MDLISNFDSEFVWRLGVFGLLYVVGSIFMLRNKLFLLFRLSGQEEKLRKLNGKLKKVRGNEKGKKSLITDFIDGLKDKYIIKTIINEWLSLQRSLSNFQKYDFDIHIDIFLERYRFNASTFARNLLLIGLLFTFLYLSGSFVELGQKIRSGGEANTYINETLIPNVGMALTSTIAAIVISFLVNIFGSYVDEKINRLHKELSDFLIIHVHPTFETAAEDTYIHKIKSVLDSLTQNIRESNQNLDAISRQSINTLKQLGEGISKFTTSTEEFKSLLREFSQVQDQINEQNKEIRLAVSGLKASVEAINTIFESETNIIEDVSESTRRHSQNINKLIEATNNLNDQQTENIDDLKHEFDEEIIQTLEKNSQRLNNSLENSVEYIERISNKLGEEFSDNKSLRAGQVEKLNLALTQITEEFSDKIEELNKNTISREKKFEEQTEQILNQQKELLKETSKYLKAVKNRVGLFNSIKKMFN